MPESETYVTKQRPNLEDWLAYNGPYFDQLRGGNTTTNAPYSPFVDVDRHAAQEGVSLEEYFVRVSTAVGSLGRAGLQLVQSDMDDAWHIVVASEAATGEQ